MKKSRPGIIPPSPSPPPPPPLPSPSPPLPFPSLSSMCIPLILIFLHLTSFSPSFPLPSDLLLPFIQLRSLSLSFLFPHFPSLPLRLPSDPTFSPPPSHSSVSRFFPFFPLFLPLPTCLPSHLPLPLPLLSIPLSPFYPLPISPSPLPLTPQSLTFAWVNFFFSGFVAAKVPFPLTQKFRGMLQNGIDLSTVDVSFVSSRS
ncbi:unnamed protein product, partial [Closterium sp. NIES-53]